MILLPQSVFPKKNYARTAGTGAAISDTDFLLLPRRHVLTDRASPAMGPVIRLSLLMNLPKGSQ